jgi:hypothetical protein
VINLEKFIYDNAIEDVLDIIDSRINYYDMADKADIVEFEIIEELKILRDIIKKLKYYQNMEE